MKLSSSTKLSVLFATAIVAAVARLPYYTDAAMAVSEQESSPRAEREQRELKKKKGGNKKDTKKQQKKTKKTDSPIDSPSDSLTPSIKPIITSKFNNVVAFGDSLTDIGNIDQFPPCTLNVVEPRLYCGDISNGLLFYEYLLELLLLPAITTGIMPNPEDPNKLFPSGGTNFAISTSTAGNGLNENDPDLLTQVKLYTAYQTLFKGATAVDPETLHFIFTGGNDVGRAFQLSPANPEAAIQQSIADYILNIESLIDLGACSFLIIGPPNSGLAPIFQSSAGPATAMHDFLIVELQKALHEVTITNNDPSCLGIEFVDFQATFNESFSEGTELSNEFPNKTDACNNRFILECDVCSDILGKFGYADFSVVPGSGGKCNCGLPVIAEDELDLDCDGFLFYDEFHPSTQSNEALANAVFENLSKTKFFQ